MKLSRRGLLSMFAILPAVRHLRGQDEPRPSFSAGVKVVNLFATVRDKKGTIVRGLNKDDFQLDEEGRPQVIRYFAQESDLPLTVGLLVDTSGSTRRVLPDERDASRQFLEQVLREDKDHAFLVHFDFEVELQQNLTSSRRQLEDALDQLETGQFRPQWRGGYPYPGGPYPYPGGSRGRYGRRGGTALFDAVYLASDEVIKKQSGRKALILLSDGEDNGSQETLSSAVEAAQRADTLVYTILFVDQGFGGYGGQRMGRRGGPWPGMNSGDGKQVMQQIAHETGGRFFEVSSSMPIDKVFAEIEEDLRNQYSLGYTPEQTENANGYRRIHLTTKQKGLTVQTREGYYAS